MYHVEDETFNYEMRFRQEGGRVACGDGSDNGDNEDADDEEEEERGGNNLGRPILREPTYPSHRGQEIVTVIRMRRVNPAGEAKSATDYRFWTTF
jgi:hypothetical protein